jgi:tRNA1(Val) A37 N6-methylase TrmN6
LEFFKTIPFLNGGLFECQDYKIKEGEKETTIRVDCFSDNPKNETRLKVSNDIFFANPSKEPWLNDIFGTKNKEYHVQGIFKILNNYKFTIQENTPLEQEIALEPDLLGIVFENLLASYNPETRETARSKTGSFYTPREIVNYMVDESLLSYLKQKLNYEIPDIKLLNLFKPIEIDVSLSNIEKNKIINAIETIKILDPACGSGAFPMGILQRLVNLLHKVDHDNELWKERILQRTPVEIRPEATKVLKGKTADYIRKLGLIQNCIYGVDIQPIAVEISKLRFFLSLLVDFVKTDNAEDNWGIEPLPNLDFKVMQGDSLMEEFNGVSLSILPVEKSSTINFIDEEFHKKIDLLYEKQSLFLRETHPSKKNVLKEAVNNSLMDIFHYHLQIIKATYFFELKRIEENKKRITDEEAAENYYLSEKSKIDRKFGFNYLKFEKDLKELISGKKPRKFFSFSLFFAEVYENGGFDIVIGNPPYYQLSKDKTLPESYKQYLKDHFQTSGGRLNTFIFFMHQGLQLLKEYGNLIYIIPNTLLTQEYYKDTRKHLLECSHINQIVHYPTMQFENAVVENITIQYEKSKIKKPTKLLVQNLNEITLKGEIDLIEEAKSPNFNFNLSENSILDKMDNQDHYLLSDLCDINQAIALKGDKSLSLKSSNPNGKYYKLLDGRNINKYTINWNGVYLDFNIDMIHSCKRKDIFESNEKLMFRRVSSTLIFTYDAYQYFALNTIVVLNKKSKNVDLKFLLGLLNSSLINYYYIEKFKSTKKVFSEIQARTIGKLPIQKKQNKSITQIVDYLLIIGKFKSESASFLFFQKVIDAIVYELYFPEIVKEVDCDILQHLKVLPGLKDDDDDGNIKIIEKLYKEFSHSTHPISSALLRMSNIEEIQIIESRK